MKHPMKKIFALLLVSVLLVSACGKQPAETQAPTKESPAPATNAPTEPVPAAETTPKAAETTAEATPAPTQPPATDPAPTEPPATEAEATTEAPTEPPTEPTTVEPTTTAATWEDLAVQAANQANWGNPAEAEALYRQALELTDEHPELWLRVAEMAERQEKEAERLEAILASGFVSAEEAAANTVGVCGETAVFVLDNKGNLTIRGTGAVYDFYFGNSSYHNSHTELGQKLRSAVIEEGIEELGSGLFDSCGNLRSVTLPDSLHTMHGSVFEYCHALREIVIPDSVQTFGGDMFMECDSLRSVQLPASLTEIPSYTFYNCRKLESVTIPAGVTKIGYVAFEQCSSLKELVLPEGLTTIEDYAFEGCYALEKINLPASITSVGENIFSHDTAMKEVYVPENSKVFALENGILTDYEKTTIIAVLADVSGTVTLPEGITEVPEGLFYDKKGLTEVILPASLRKICAGAFDDCCDLVQLNIPEGVTEIGDYAFDSCTSLKSVSLPSSLKSIGYLAFNFCTALEKIEIPDSVTKLGERAFQNCKSLTEVRLPKTLTEIPKDCFAYCESLKKIELPDGVSIICYAAFNACFNLEEVIWPESLGIIKSWAFGWTALKEVTLPEGVAEIQSNVFGSSKLEKIWLPKSLEELDDYVFEDGVEIFYAGSEDDWDDLYGDGPAHYKESCVMHYDADGIAFSPLDYSLAENWAYFELSPEKDVDVFLICPTVDTKSETNSFDLNDKLKGRFVNALDMEKGIYEETGRLFSPYYRQMSINAYTLPADGYERAKQTAYADVAASFRWYLENENGGRGLILAGFSQGAEMCLELLKEFYGGDSAEAAKLRDGLITVYALGWTVTKEMTEAYPQIVPAAGELDVGTVVSFDCENGTLTETIIIPAGVAALSINPLNWKTDGTKADKSLNLGAVMSTGAEAVPALCGAYIGARGELIVTDVKTEDYPPVLDIFPEGAFHLYDYMFFFTNLKQNIADRTAAWKAAH